jgi:hypothetical protein
LAWALHLARLLPKHSPKVLLNKLSKKRAFRGSRSGREFYIYFNPEFVAKEQFDLAREELEKIQKGGYHPIDHELPLGYRAHKAEPLESHSEQLLAQVLHEVGILTRPEISHLRDKLKNRQGGVFGMVTDDANRFVLYLHQKYAGKLQEAQRLLHSQHQLSQER